MPRPERQWPLTDPAHIADVFASGFDVQDWEDWLRLICWVETIEPDRNGGQAARRVVASVVIPRSSLHELMKALRLSASNHRGPRRHS